MEDSLDTVLMSLPLERGSEFCGGNAYRRLKKKTPCIELRIIRNYFQNLNKEKGLLDQSHGENRSSCEHSEEKAGGAQTEQEGHPRTST